MSKRRLTRSTGYWSLRGRTGGAWRLGTSDGEQAPVAHEPHGRWPPRDQHRDARRPPRSPAWRASLSPPRTEYLVVVDFGYLRLENFVAHAPGIGQLVTMGVSRTLGAMHADAREHLADRPGRKRPAVVLDEGAEDFELTLRPGHRYVLALRRISWRRTPSQRHAIPVKPAQTPSPTDFADPLLTQPPHHNRHRITRSHHTKRFDPCIDLSDSPYGLSDRSMQSERDRVSIFRSTQHAHYFPKGAIMHTLMAFPFSLDLMNCRDLFGHRWRCIFYCRG